jgi:hypothetical protein
MRSITGLETGGMLDLSKTTVKILLTEQGKLTARRQPTKSKH